MPYRCSLDMRVNFYFFYLPIISLYKKSLQDEGVSYLSDALIEQSRYLRDPSAYNQSTNMNYSQLSASLNYLNNNKCYSPSFKSQAKQTWFIAEDEKPKVHLLSRNNSLNNNSEDDTNKDSKNEQGETEANTNDQESDLEQKSLQLPAIIEHIDVTTDATPSQQRVDPDTEPKIQQNTEKSKCDPNNLINANVEIKSKDKEKIEECSSLVKADDSPLNSRSLKEELEFAVNKNKEVQVMVSPDASMKFTAVDLLESKSVDTYSSGEIEEKTTVLIPARAPERSFSSESLNSLTSLDSNDSKSSIRITENKFAKNGTLERQQNAQNINEKPRATPTCLRMLVLWNNKITKASSKTLSDMLCSTISLQMLNIGRNNLGNDFIVGIKTSLRINNSLQTLGLQGTHLSCPGESLQL